MKKRTRAIKVRQFKPSKVTFTNDAKIITWKKSRKIISNKVLKSKIGQLQLTVVFHKKGRVSLTEFGYSYLFDLSSKTKFMKARMVALRSAWGKVPFSPDGFTIIGEKYIYVESIEPK